MNNTKLAIFDFDYTIRNPTGKGLKTLFPNEELPAEVAKLR